MVEWARVLRSKRNGNHFELCWFWELQNGSPQGNFCNWDLGTIFLQLCHSICQEGSRTEENLITLLIPKINTNVHTRVVFCWTSCCNSSHFFLTLNYLKLFLLGISMTKKTFSSLMDLNFLEEFFSGYGKWKISFQQLRHSTFNEFTFCEDERFLEESEFIITGSYRFGSLKPKGNNYWSPYYGGWEKFSHIYS